MIIMCDVDGVLADFTGALFQALVQEGAPRYTDQDLTQWDLKACIDPQWHPALERVSTRKGFCSGIQRYDRAQEFYKSLRKRGRVLAVTTAWKGASWEQERYDWLLSFGFADPEIHIVRSHEEKHAVPCDVVIEDRLETMQNWPQTGAMKILVNRPWNQQSERLDQIHGIMRAGNYAQVIGFVRAKETMVQNGQR